MPCELVQIPEEKEEKGKASQEHDLKSPGVVSAQCRSAGAGSAL